MATPTPVGSTPATATYNIDVASIVRRWNRILVELDKSQSSGVSQLITPDLTRLVSYVAAMTAYQAFVVGQPILDCPETGPTLMPLQADPVIDETENESIFDCIQLVTTARDELKNSQSSRLPTNLMSFDYNRQTSYIAKITALIAYIQTAEPLDLPKSSPEMAVTGPGQVGV
jgi:hypothetical protein